MADVAMQVEWVLGRFIGDRAKSVIDHANAGMGYFIIEQGKQGNQQTCLAAFRRAMDSPVPEHLDLVRDMSMLRKLNDRHDARHGTDRGPKRIVNQASAAKIAEIKSMFDNRKATERRDLDG